MIEDHKNEVIVYYNGQRNADKSILAYVNSYFNHVRTVDVTNQKITGTRLEEIAMRVGVSVSELINHNCEAYEKFANTLDEHNDQDCIKIIQHNPELLRTPIVITKDKAIIAKGTTDIMNLLSENAW